MGGAHPQVQSESGLTPRVSWKQYASSVEWHFNPQVATPQARVSAEALRERLSEDARRSLEMKSDIRYGAAERQMLDFFPAADARAIQIYFHGGYWRRGDKRASSYVAVPFMRRRIATAVMNYGLCPAVPLETSIAQAMEGIAWVAKNASQLGIPNPRIFLSGHSAGAHLCATALAHDWSAHGLDDKFICGAALVSGIYDVEPVLHISLNEQVRLTADRVQALSPMLHPPSVRVPVLLAVGGQEAAGWQDQTVEYERVCREAGCETMSIRFPDDDHYSITVAAHGRDESPLVAAIAEVIARPSPALRPPP